MSSSVSDYILNRKSLFVNPRIVNHGKRWNNITIKSKFCSNETMINVASGYHLHVNLDDFKVNLKSDINYILTNAKLLPPSFFIEIADKGNKKTKLLIVNTKILKNNNIDINLYDLKTVESLEIDYNTLDLSNGTAEFCVNTGIDVISDDSNNPISIRSIEGYIHKTNNISGYEATLIRKKLNWMLGTPYIDVYDAAATSSVNSISETFWKDRRITFYEPLGFIPLNYLTTEMKNNIKSGNQLSIKDCEIIYNNTIHDKINNPKPNEIGYYINPLLYPPGSEIYRYPYRQLLSGSEKYKYNELIKFAAKWSEYPLININSGHPEYTTDYKNYSFPKSKTNPFKNLNEFQNSIEFQENRNPSKNQPSCPTEFNKNINSITNSVIQQINNQMVPK